MTKLAEIVKVERRFALSARIDTDLNGTPPLTGYVLQASIRKSLVAMLTGIAEGSQYAFTWTGPYGGGKSCAALLVANLVVGNKRQRALAEGIVGPELAELFASAFPRRGGAWDVLALTGRRTSLTAALAETAAGAFQWSQTTVDAALQDERALIDELEANARQKGGLLIVIDELGKFLEHATNSAGDVHILQDLAERAARSDGRLVIVGILHQSFEQYANRLSRAGRNEWAKVQGRYQNVPFVAQADEIAALIARAIGSHHAPINAKTIAARTAEAISHRRPVDVAGLTEILNQTWPLHPVSALLLGPVSRQRFAQNERSVFGFLSSSEPNGFQAHLERTEVSENAWYGPDQLWDYLVSNFGSALSVGPESNRMTLAMEAVEKAALYGPLATKLAKAAAVVELFRNGSGLAVADDILSLCVPEAKKGEIAAAIDELVNRAILIRQPRLGGYALFAGSDFDLDEAISKVALKLDADVLADLPSRLGVGPIAAKSHYFSTGALRTFDVVIQFIDESSQSPTAWAKRVAVSLAKTKRRSVGLLIMLLSDARTFEVSIKVAAKQLSIELESLGVLAGVAASEKVYLLRDHATDLYALDRIEETHPQLEGDRIARRELSARKALIAEIVRSDLLKAFSSARWWAFGSSVKDSVGKKLDGRELTVIASALSTAAFSNAPVIQSELLYRDKPSTAAMAGLRALMHAMVSKADVSDLGIKSYPVERGLYLTIIQPLGLHRQDDNGVWRFTDPAEDKAGRTLKPAWTELSEGRVNLAELFDKWAARPYGIKRGVMPVLVLSYLLAHRNAVAVYIDGVFQPAIDDIVADRILQDPVAIEFRHISRSKRDEAFIQQLAALLSTEAVPVEAKALPVASALYQRFHALPLWAQRTQTLPEKVRNVRDIVLKANDPEALLFSDLASALDGEPDPGVSVVAALNKTEYAYPKMLDTLRKGLAEHLGVDAKTFAGIGSRSLTASGVSAELRVDAFIMRAGAFEGGEGDIEGLASLLVHKPPRNWSDREQEQAMFELAKLCLRFREAETFAAVRGRSPTSQAISVMVGLNPKNKPLFHSFQVSEQELVAADKVAEDLMEQLRQKGMRPAVELAALARIVERLSDGEGIEQA
ncbi:hypothetical protein [Pleomorphomonas koreensis]|uniref:hypothetical protein n=1 Tax=Pleomorphomonas koreensis TaxID=257440 RepID=UPI00040CEDB7|nr:hypothetical protein [Pleomorphomonas koreensis]